MDKMEDYSYLRTASIFAGAIGIVSVTYEISK